MESFVADLKKQVQCSLCNDTFTEPKILSCFHTFCKPCIKRHAEQVDQVNIFKCPTCTCQTFLPEHIEDLQPSLLHSRILKGLALVEGEKVCSVSESHSTAAWYCFDCDRSICNECKKYHAEFAKNHPVVHLSDLKKEDVEFIITREISCTSHPQHRLEFFCKGCDDMFCKTGLIDHRNHNTMFLDEFASIKKAGLPEQLQILEQLRTDDDKTQQQEKIANAIKQQGEKAKKEVKDKTKKIIEMVQEKERELLRQIDEKLEIATTNLNIIHHIPAVKEYIKSVMERGLASEMMNIQETQCFQKFIFKPIPLHSRIEFIPNQELMRQTRSGLGEIQKCLKTDHTKSTIEVESETEALKKQNLVLITKTSTGEPNYDPMDVIDVRLKPEENAKITKKYVRIDGKVEVEFMVKVAGRLTAEVQVNGKHVSNSPLVVNAKPQEMRTTGKLNINSKSVNTGSSWLRGIAVNRDNSRIAVADFSSHCVYVVTTDGDFLLTYGRQGTQGQLPRPEGVAFVNDADLVIADWIKHRICIVNTTTGALVKTFGNQGSGDGEFYHPYGVHVDDDGNIIVCDNGNHRVQVFTGNGDYQYQFGLTTQDKFDPIDVMTRDEGHFYVSDFTNDVIHVFEKKGAVPTRISTIGGPGNGDGQLFRPWGLAIDNDHHLLVCDYGNNRVQKFTLDGRFVGKTCDVIKYPQHITVLKDAQILVSAGCSGVLCVK